MLHLLSVRRMYRSVKIYIMLQAIIYPVMIITANATQLMDSNYFEYALGMAMTVYLVAAIAFYTAFFIPDLVFDNRTMWLFTGTALFFVFALPLFMPLFCKYTYQMRVDQNKQGYA